MGEPETNIVTGQVWSLKRCSNRAAVHLIETIGDERIVHVSILNGDGDIEVGHAPFDRAAFLRSVDRVLWIGSDDTAFREGYPYWRAEFERGAAGVFNVDVCEM